MTDAESQRIQDSEERRKAMKKERRQQEGEIIHQNKQPKKMYKGRSFSGIETSSGTVHRGKDWYSK
tara:strand:+ start:63 stop:260 length:198 start_codon:yes stop_codon:yes gene_type:complete